MEIPLNGLPASYFYLLSTARLRVCYKFPPEEHNQSYSPWLCRQASHPIGHLQNRALFWKGLYVTCPSTIPTSNATRTYAATRHSRIRTERIAASAYGHKNGRSGGQALKECDTPLRP